MESWSVSPSRCGQWICCRIHSEFAAGYIVYPTISTKANFACTTENRWIWLEDHHPNCLVASKSCHLHRVGVRPTLLQLFFSNDFNHMFWRRECTLLLNEGIGNVASSMEYFSSWCHTLSCHFDSSSNMVHLTFTVTGYTVHPDDIFVIHFSDDLQMLKMESWLTLGGAIITTNDDIAALYIFLCKHFSNHNISENLALLPGIEYIYISVCVCVCDVIDLSILALDNLEWIDTTSWLQQTDCGCSFITQNKFLNSTTTYWKCCNSLQWCIISGKVLSRALMTKLRLTSVDICFICYSISIFLRYPWYFHWSWTVLTTVFLPFFFSVLPLHFSESLFQLKWFARLPCTVQPVQTTTSIRQPLI